MQLTVEWSKPILLRYNKKKDEFVVPLAKLPSDAGVYIFGRKYGQNFEALYIGKAGKIRSRVKGQLNNMRLMHHVRDARSGRRILLAGVFDPRPGQQEDRCLPLIEKALIRHFLSEGHDLVNKSGTRLRQHEIISRGRHPKRYFAKAIFLDSK
jgi:hypothetical protein